jgi:hypothetical protein
METHFNEALIRPNNGTTRRYTPTSYINANRKAILILLRLRRFATGLDCGKYTMNGASGRHLRRLHYWAETHTRCTLTHDGKPLFCSSDAKAQPRRDDGIRHGNAIVQRCVPATSSTDETIAVNEGERQ